MAFQIINFDAPQIFNIRAHSCEQKDENCRCKNGYHSLSVANTYQDLGKKNLLKLAAYFGINKGNEIIDQVKETLSKWNRYSSETQINKKESELVEKTLLENLKK